MIPDPSEYPVSISDGNFLLFKIPKYSIWLQQNDIPVKFYSGRIYFKEEEHATLFKLRFGV